ncbi:periplasmic heavy metal sensor [Emcibacter sp.]|uniref:periplasmic heavy metal sensor n=1 Tax=Emcibacter sp. TaxID=1979954 RepID=UPI002AA92FC5|nr:periplasmic heavy metal sensor [Emcibacter sp.]
MRKILSNKWVHILLFVSIIVNVFMAGFIVARERFDRPDRRGFEKSGLAFLARSLPREQRREIFENIRDQREEFQEVRQQLAQINSEVLELLGVDEIDREKLEDLLRRERELHLQGISRFQEGLIQGIINLPLEKRRHLLEEARRRLSERGHDRPHWGRGPHSDDMPPPPPGG